MRIDAHQHFWEVARFPYPWMPAEPSPLHQDLLPPVLGRILKRNRFDGSIAVQAATHAGEAEWLLSLAEAHPFILGVVAWVDLTDAALAHRLDQLQRHRWFKGVRHPVHDESDPNWLLREDVVRGLQELACRDLPYDLLLRPAHLPLIPSLAERVPRLRMVIDHLAKPRIAEGVLDGWAADIERAASIPQMFVKLSGMITEDRPDGWSADRIRPFVQHALRVFGPERAMFGSDWPV
ncbi:MAG: amidohydrolase family protein, partial [Bryobacteraceae bacterium]